MDTDKIWTAVAEHSGDTAFGATICCESGVALRFPPQSKPAVAAQNALCLSVCIRD
jgi:hypothetical protein